MEWPDNIECVTERWCCLCQSKPVKYLCPGGMSNVCPWCLNDCKTFIYSWSASNMNMSFSTLDMKSSNSFATNGGPLWPDNTHMTVHMH